MSTTFLRGLKLLEIVGIDGPIGITELARRVDADKGTVSRMVTAAERDGWLVRTPGGVALGPRLPVLAHGTPRAAVLRDVEPLVDAVAGVTGLFAQVYMVVGGGVVPVLSAGRPPIGMPDPPLLEMPIWLVAAGRAAVALLSDDEIEALLPDGPFVVPANIAELNRSIAGPAADDGAPTHQEDRETAGTRAALFGELARIRASGLSYDRGEANPYLHCIARPWPGLDSAAAITVIGRSDDITAGADLIEAVLLEAVAPGTTRERIVMSAARAATGRTRA
ncbi:MAG: IclR family transcriptional regulator C-terminal domain-containing protein [Marmoricola sp.]